MPNSHLTIEEVKRRNDSGETLILFRSGVYNVSNFGKAHPGGLMALHHMKGLDATDAITALHPAYVIEKRMGAFKIGVIAESDLKESKVSTAWHALHAQLTEDGLFDTNMNFWVQEVAKLASKFRIFTSYSSALFVTAVFMTVLANDRIWMHLAGALTLALFWHQAAFMAHDGGHNSITHERKVDNLFCIGLANAFGGISIGWWKKSHNTHHVVTNSPEHDPDIQHMPFFAVTTKFFEGLYSSYHKRTMTFDLPTRALVSIQHYLFYIVMCFGRFNLYAQSFIHLADPLAQNRTPEIIGLVVFWSWFSVMLSYIPSWSVLGGYVFVSHAMTFLLHVQITISHFGMSTDVIEGEGFPEKALRTTMDVDCPTWMDWFHGGLQVTDNVSATDS